MAGSPKFYKASAPSHRSGGRVYAAVTVEIDGATYDAHRLFEVEAPDPRNQVVDELPEATFDRRLFAFLDGCYDASTDRFYAHAECPVFEDRWAAQSFPHAFGATYAPRRMSSIDLPELATPHHPVDAAFMLAHLEDILQETGHDTCVRELLESAATSGGRAGVDVWAARLAEAVRGSPPQDAALALRVARSVWRHHPSSEHLCLETDGLDTILEAQSYDLGMRSLVYAVLGRMLYKVGELDSWSILPWIIGRAGTGMSTLLGLARRFYPAHATGNMSTRIGAFELGRMFGVFAWVCPEARRDVCRLPDDDLRAMLGGDEMVLPRPHQSALAAKWTAPGMMCGNQVPAPDDPRTQRVLPLFFDRPIPRDKTDVRLMQRICFGDAPEFGRLIRKCNVAYRKLAASVGARDLWDDELVWLGIVPAALHDFRAQLAAP